MKTAGIAFSFALGLCTMAAPLLAADKPADAPPANVNDYKLGPDSERHEGVPLGKVTKFIWNTSKVYPDTERDCAVYVPAQYDGKTPACVMVFQDGSAYSGEKGAMRVPIVFDNLIAKGDMPVTIGIFVDPGHKGGKDARGKYKQSTRSLEYDTVNGDYAKFLLEEILPEVAKQYKLTDDPDGRAICGMSSGGICAFTVAWEHPEAFHKVLSHIGSFTNIRGGYVYPSLIRKTKANPKPIRVFLQDGENDIDNEFGNWPLANKEMAAALKYAGYDYKAEWGHGNHNPNHGGAILPDSLRWLWRDYKKTEAK
ncbi:MAG TPA: alpha/beta hydrolase-fold protein [Tepidisphaeraceae bacterium]|jgi:enterochelin esterase family protein|nr:alpha/beta hydrolase-fold protein [Tepidisphaeraceae bacterium]